MNYNVKCVSRCESQWKMFLKYCFSQERKKKAIVTYGRHFRKCLLTNTTNKDKVFKVNYEIFKPQLNFNSLCPWKSTWIFNAGHKNGHYCYHCDCGNSWLSVKSLYWFFSKKRMAMYEKAQIKEMGKMHRELKSTTGRKISKWSEITKVCAWDKEKNFEDYYFVS